MLYDSAGGRVGVDDAEAVRHIANDGQMLRAFVDAKQHDIAGRYIFPMGGIGSASNCDSFCKGAALSG